MLAGVICGARSYKAASEARFRAAVLNVMIFLSLAGLFRVFLWG
jgi:hypothetical protein